MPRTRRAPQPLAYASAPASRVDSDPENYDLAVASIACGLFVFVPFIPGAMSLIFGVGVLRRARLLRPRDLTLAVIGTTLGTINVVLSAVFLVAGLTD